MKRILLLLLLIAPQANAETMVFYYKDTKEVLFIAEEKNVSLSAEEASKVDKMSLPARFDIKDLDRPLDYYRVSNGNIVLNNKKVSDIEARLEKIAQKEAERTKIEKRSRKIAYDQLKAEGVEFEHIKESDL